MQQRQVKPIVGCLLVSAACLGLVLLLAVSLLAALVSSALGQSGTNPCAQASGTPASPVSTGTPSEGCIAASGIAAAVVNLAEQMAGALYVNPACGGTISYPDCYYTWYNSSFPQSVIAYGNRVCPGCYAWANGTYQCVSFVRGAYGPIYPMPWTANAFDLWALYQGKPGWQEIPAAAPSGESGMPLPGDVMVFKDSSIGHVAIVVSVMPPANGQNGSVTFANANSVSPYTTMPLLPDLTVDASSWPGYTVWGYIRPAATGTTNANRQLAAQGKQQSLELFMSEPASSSNKRNGELTL